MPTYKIITSSSEETEQLAKKIGAQLQAGDVIAFFGDLGAGKTTFTRGLAAGMHLPDAVSSPTFTIVHEHHGTHLSLYHFDMYRIENADDLDAAGFYDYSTDGAVFAIEWSEHIAPALPEGAIRITITVMSETSRDITIETPRYFESLEPSGF